MSTRKNLKKNLKKVKMTKRVRKICMKLHKLGKRRSKLTKRTKNKRMRNKRTFSKKRGRFSRGGFGRGACPFVGAPWDATGKAYFHKLSKNGVAPGGVPVFPGSLKQQQQQQQSGGEFFQPIINSFRVVETGTQNVVNRYKGQRLKPSPLPMYDQLKRRNYKL